MLVDQKCEAVHVFGILLLGYQHLEFDWDLLDFCITADLIIRLGLWTVPPLICPTKPLSPTAVVVSSFVCHLKGSFYATLYPPTLPQGANIERCYTCMPTCSYRLCYMYAGVPDILAACPPPLVDVIDYQLV